MSEFGWEGSVFSVLFTPLSLATVRVALGKLWTILSHPTHYSPSTTACNPKITLTGTKNNYPSRQSFCLLLASGTIGTII